MTLSSVQDTHVTLPGSRRYHRAGSEVGSRSDRFEMVEVTIKVRRKKPLPDPVPGKTIPHATLLAEYGADAADLKTVEDTLVRLGLTVIDTSEVTRSLHVVGPVNKMETVFGVHLFRAKLGEVVYRCRTGDIHLPVELQEIVTGVFGLDTRPMVKRRRSHGTHAAAIPPASHRSWYLPQELAKAYDFPDGDGDGQTIGILEFGGHYVEDCLTSFLDLTGITDKPEVKVKNIHVLSAADRNNEDAIGEVMLDVEVVAGVCPKANVNLYFSRWSEQGWIDNLDAVLHDVATLSVVSISYGLAEGDDIWTQQAIDHVNETLKELANAGLTVCVSSGDDGSDDQVPDGAAHLDFPASSPYVLSVGGTVLDRSTGEEVVWFDGDGLRRHQGGSTGGGVSAMNKRPSWQVSDIKSANPHGPAGRIVPDVAANAAGSTGYFMVSTGGPEVSGGTSAAAPLWATLIARIRAKGVNVGFLTPRLYETTANGDVIGQIAFRDITQGSNSSGTSPGYSARSGFDAVTGWGSPKGGELLNRL